MTSISRARAATIVLSAAAVVLVAACSSGGKSASAEMTPQQALLAAATQTQQVTSATESLSVKTSGASGSTTTGTFQVQLKPALMLGGNLNVTAAGASQQLKMIVTDTALYFNDPSLTGQVGKPWVEIDLSALDAGGTNLAQLFHSLQSNDFAKQAQLSTVAKNARVVGTQTVDGVSTTEYAGSVKASVALKALPASFRQVMAAELQALGNSTIYFHEWVDGQHHMRKLSEVETVNGDAVNTTITVTAINQPVHIKLPSASQTYSLQGGDLGSGTSSGGTSSSGGLAAKIVPAPLGFAQASSNGYSGPIAASDFNQITGSGTAAKYHFVRGYGASYTSTSNSDTILVFLFQFATPSDATTFKGLFPSGISATPKPDLIIPGADDYDATSPSGGTYSHAVVGTKGKVVFVVDDETGSTAPVPMVETLARQQYAAL